MTGITAAGTQAWKIHNDKISMTVLPVNIPRALLTPITGCLDLAQGTACIMCLFEAFPTLVACLATLGPLSCCWGGVHA